MLTAVRLKDFKNHVDTEIRLGRLTCLVGPNGCGKTSVLEGIQFACTTFARGAIAFFQGIYLHDDFIRKGRNGFIVRTEAIPGRDQTGSLGIQLDLRNVALPCYPKKPGEAFGGIGVTAEWRTHLADAGKIGVVTAQGDVVSIKPTSGTGPVTTNGLTKDILPLDYWDSVTSAFLFCPDIPRLRSPSYSTHEIPKLSADGATLASVIAYLITTEPERFTELQTRIRDVIPAIQRLRTRPAKIELTEAATVSVKGREIPYSETREVIGHELLFDLKDAPGVSARAVSEGTLLVTALLTATVWNQGADVLLIDDLEKGLHPKAQRELVTALKALLATDPKLQIAFSTHSPYVVDELTADQVWVLVPDEERGVVARQLSDHPRAADALQVLTTGEFLSAEGEDWVRESPAAA